MGASFGNSSTTKAPCEVSNLIMKLSVSCRLSFRHALVAGEIGVRAYITEAGEDKRLSHIRALRRTVLEEQPPRAGEVRGRPAHDLAQARERFQAGSERRPRLMGQSWRRHG